VHHGDRLLYSRERIRNRRCGCGENHVALYLQNMRLATVMDDLKAEMGGKGTTVGNLRLYLNKRVYLEGIDVSLEDVKITPTGVG
jgi:hypothetical protein